jgi:hypothetical protein
MVHGAERLTSHACKLASYMRPPSPVPPRASAASARSAPDWLTGDRPAC